MSFISVLKSDNFNELNAQGLREIDGGVNWDAAGECSAIVGGGLLGGKIGLACGGPAGAAIGGGIGSIAGVIIYTFWD